MHLRIGLSIFLLIAACSAPQPNNQWQYDASSSLHAYQEHFLQDHLLRAKSELLHARDFASQSARLHTRIDIELSVCAMQLSVLKPLPCDKAAQLLDIEPDPVQLAYLHLLTSVLEQQEIKHLPKQYREFASALLNGDQTQVDASLGHIKPLSSKLLASALAKELLTPQRLQELIDDLSFYGYKNPLLVWLDVQLQKETDPLKKEHLRIKLDLLTSG